MTQARNADSGQPKSSDSGPEQGKPEFLREVRKKFEKDTVQRLAENDEWRRQSRRDATKDTS